MLLAWAAIEKEQDRIESGFLPADTRGTVSSLRAATLACVVGTIGLFVAQMMLMQSGFYDPLWNGVIAAFVDIAGPG